MSGRDLTALILASAVITLDGTAVTVALPSIGRDLGVPLRSLQWIGNAPLLMLAALLLSAGTLADRYGRLRVMRIGLGVFCAASAACAAAQSDVVLIGARFVQGAGGALVLPGAVATLRAAYADPVERTRKFGLWAAGTGAAGAVGPLLGGALADFLSWRAVFVVSAGVAATAALLLERTRADRGDGRMPLPLAGTAALILLLGATTFLLIEGTTGGWASAPVLAAGLLVPTSLIVLARPAQRQALLPGELLTARNCLAANSATFAMYFGVFGLSFLLVLYTQQALGYSGGWAGASILPVSVMLFLAEPFGRMAARVGTRAPIVLGAVVAAAGILWLAAGGHPLAFWSRIIVGTCLFGLGVSMATSALTHAAVSGVPEQCAGAASGFNHATVRAAGVIAIALLGSLAAGGRPEGISVDGFRQAMVSCGLLVALVGIASGWRIRNDEPGGLQPER